MIPSIVAVAVLWWKQINTDDRRVNKKDKVETAGPRLQVEAVGN